ncbi:ABC transporter ATP-binding protein [Anaerobranca gottschalkii]|uniref:Putative ABC transport system ATP-binding protein n=1 Tax=Anaerobranca gottschalkii DSM 13577 TaxID=1120990 RepID=A0A1H9YES3_9FIRM|nr:ABC transporter ATP-binding protein [Anaerobranca gottschalkii]SES66973.1 putative ABC transport system ATP-binding protein [Anaerobranca gottschalkii DSM 13577]
MIELVGINKSYPQKKDVLKDISLRIPEKSFVSIMGKSGSGKTTLLNILGLIDSFSKGKYLFYGKDISKLNSSHLAHVRNQNIGFVFQAYNLIPGMSVYENVMLPHLYSRQRINQGHIERIHFLLKRFNLTDLKDKDVNLLSGGEKQRVSLCRALTLNPNLIIADEPTGNLDNENTQIVMDYFKELNMDGKTIIIVTHDINVAQQATTRFFLEEGVLLK